MVKTKRSWGSLARGGEHGFQLEFCVGTVLPLVANTTVYAFALKCCGNRSRRYNMLLMANTEEV